MKLPDGKGTYIIANNAEGKIDVIQQGKQTPYKSLNIDMMHCSLVHGQHLLIGSYSKLYLVDLNNDFAVLGQLHVCRHIFSICAANQFTVVCGQQGGQLAAVTIQDNQMVKVAENKVTSGIYKVVRTTQDDFALACSGGLYFAKLDPIKRKFTLQKDFLLADHLVT